MHLTTLFKLLSAATLYAMAHGAESPVHVPFGSSRRAFVSLLTGNAYNNTMLLQAQIASVAEHEHITLVLPDVSDDTRALVAASGSQVVEVPEIHPPETIDNVLYQKAFAKLHVWNLVDYDQVVFLDYDAYLTSHVQSVWEACQADFCGVLRKQPQDAIDQDPTENWINTGVMILRPSAERFHVLVEELLPQGLEDPTYVEEGFIAQVLSSSDSRRGFGSVQILDWTFNTCSEDYFRQVDQCLSQTSSHSLYQHSPAFTKCFNEMSKQVQIFHHCGAYRMNHDDLCDGPNSPLRCRLDFLTEFQTLLRQANPCVQGNLGADHCGALDSCHWCGADVRCIPDNAECHLDEWETQVLIGRHKDVMGTWKPYELPKVWATLLTGESYNNTVLIATQILSVKRHSQYKHVTMVLPEIGSVTRAYLESLGSTVVEVPELHPKQKVQSPWYNKIFAKLNIVSMTQYEQVAYLDADAFLVSSQSDMLFRECEDSDFCSVERQHSDELEDDWPKPWINGGMLVVRPSAERFRYLIEERLHQDYPYDGFLDEAFYITVLAEGERGLGKGKLVNWIYNTCSQDFFDHMDRCEAETNSVSWREPNVGFADCLNKATNDAAIVHHCGLFRMTSAPLCLWDIGQENEYCRINQVADFQHLLLQANPCAVGGQSENHCHLFGGGRCQWCNSDIRCVATNRQCHTESEDSQTLAFRSKLVNKEWTVKEVERVKSGRKRSKSKLLPQQQKRTETLDFGHLFARDLSLKDKPPKEPDASPSAMASPSFSASIAVSPSSSASRIPSSPSFSASRVPFSPSSSRIPASPSSSAFR